MRELTLDEMAMVSGGGNSFIDPVDPNSVPMPGMPTDSLGRPVGNPLIGCDALDDAADSIRNGKIFTAVGQVVGGAPEIAGNVADRLVEALFEALKRDACEAYSRSNGPNAPLTCPTPAPAPSKK